MILLHRRSISHVTDIPLSCMEYDCTDNKIKLIILKESDFDGMLTINFACED